MAKRTQEEEDDDWFRPVKPAFINVDLEVASRRSLAPLVEAWRDLALMAE